MAVETSVWQEPGHPNVFRVFTRPEPRSGEEMKIAMEFINEVAQWCKATFRNEYESWDIVGGGTAFVFYNDEELMLFKLRWV
jgi:hypothetical protein